MLLQDSAVTAKKSGRKRISPVNDGSTRRRVGKRSLINNVYTKDNEESVRVLAVLDHLKAKMTQEQRSAS